MCNATRAVGTGTLLPVTEPVKQKNRKSSRPSKRPKPAAETVDPARLVTISLTAAAPDNPHARIQWHRDIDPLREGHFPDDFVMVPVERSAAYDLVCDGKARVCPAWRQPPVGPRRTVVLTAMMTARHLEQIGLTMFADTAHENSRSDFFVLPFAHGSAFTIKVDDWLVADEPPR